MLCQDYLTYGMLASQSAARGTFFSGHCRICLGEWDAIPILDWTALSEDEETLNQFIIYPCSMNLKNSRRVPLNIAHLPTLISLCRELCFRFHNLGNKLSEI